MPGIAIVTDSTAYLSEEYIQTRQIKVIPLVVTFGSETYRENADLTTRQFYDMLPKVKELPTTSQPPVGEFVQVFESLLQSYDSVIGIFLSSGLSGTFNSAQTAAGMVEGEVTVIDSKLTSYTLQGMVREAADMRDAGKGKEEIIERMNAIATLKGAFFVVDSLEHLHRGGRISGLSALLGSIMQVKPVLYATEDGRLDVFEKVRTKRKALDRVVEKFREDKESKPGQPVHAGIVYSNNIDEAIEFQKRVKEELPDINFELSELGPVIGTHVGPGVLAIVYYIG